MAQDDQNEFPIATGSEIKTIRQTSRHLPGFFRTDPNKKFLGGTLDPLTQPGKLTRINAYIGHHDIPNYNFDDSYLEETTNSRQYYQLEPAFVYDDAVTGKVNWYADYNDYINSLVYFGAFTGNHSNLNMSEAYAWDPNIDWDKFVNYREYYWLPNGPDPITIYGESETIVSTYSVTARFDNNNTAYIFSPDGLTANPRLTLYRGQTYRFNISANGYPFCIKTRPEIGPSYFYNNGVSKQLVQNGIIEFTVPYEAPSVLYYLNNNDINSISIIEIKDVKDAAFLDVDLTISGKKTFTSANGIEFINGLKLQFAGNVVPTTYATGTWYVEGVGNKIKLINSKDLENPIISSNTLDTPFENQPFDSLPWETADNYSVTKDYIVINRASRDKNSWSRNNRWFHINVINTTSKANGQVSLFDQNERATRPIIEFAPNMKLFNNGWITKQDVDLVDTTTTDIFSIIEGSTGYHIDEELVYPGYRILFLADTDDLVVGRTFVVTKIFNANENKTQLSLQKVDDTEPVEGQVVYVKKGAANRGNSYHFQNGVWALAQKKIKVNQTPLFDLFDENYNSFSDNRYYPFNNFTGNGFFSYLPGTGLIDTELGFPLSYHFINNVGDIQFSFDLQKQSWTYQDNNTLKTVQSYTGFVRKLNDDGTFSYTNGWVRTYKNLEQPVVRVLRVNTATDLIPIDVFDNSGIIPSLSVRVYVNNVKVDPKTISFQNIQGYYYIKFSSQLSVDDKVVYKVKSRVSKNAKGYYEIPHNWQNNPFNQNVDTFTFGEVTDHVGTIIDNILPFSGNFPGISNLSSLGPIAHYGQRFLQHAGSFPLAAFVLTDKHANIIKALRHTATKYTAFKKEFIRLATTTAFDGTPAEIVDSILATYSSAKYLDQSAFYYSDMATAGGATSIRNYTVVDPRLPVFVIDSIFTHMTTSKRVVLVYLNDVQLIYGIDYNFETTDAFVRILSNLKIGDQITIKDYSNTDGRTYIPYTPTKLGLFPIYVPRIYIDDTYTTPTKVIQGHDGSITVAYNDYRDDLILELEKRIFNCRKVEYDPSMFNIDDVIGGYYRLTDFTKDQVNIILVGDFLKWNSIADLDLSSNNYYVDENSFTYNYNRCVDTNNVGLLNGYWRGIYKYFYDTDRPHTCPWEMLGFTIKPLWWDTVYGPAPYTSENRILWDHLERGIIADPANPRINTRYIRTGLINQIPVDTDGNLLSPLDSNLAQGFSLINGKGEYTFGDQAPVETAWRRSSEYPYSIVSALCLLRGAEYIGKMWDRFTIKRNIAGQVYSTVTGSRIQPANLTYPNIPIGNSNDLTVPVTVTAGLVNFIEEYLFDAKYVNRALYKETLKALDAKLSYRIGGYTSKEHINVLLDSRSPNATGTIFLPVENYKVFYNKSSPVQTVSYSGVIIEKVGTSYPQWLSGHRYSIGDRILFQADVYQCISTHVSNNSPAIKIVQQFNQDIGYWNKEIIQKIGYKVRGYDNEKNYFEVFGYRPTQNDPTINVGGISESYVIWEPSKYYIKGQVIRFDNLLYYRAIINHTSSTNFDSDVTKWVQLPKLPIVGGATAIRRTRFGTTPIPVFYGTIFSNIQEVVDFLLGYQKRLENWGFSFDDYNKNLDVPLTWLTSAKEFMFWTLQNWSSGAVITLSPSANMVQFTPVISASVDNTNTDFYDYSIFKADGSPLKSELTDTYRDGAGFVIKPSRDSNNGIFHIRANLVYKEHVLLFDNVSIFNDILYDKIPGYRQGRLKLIGYKTSYWNGSYTSPGFMYDAAEIIDWKPNTDYMIGDTVRYKNYYFTAPTNILSKHNFNYTDWKQLAAAPVAGLIPNFDYKTEQFRDFYSLDASMFDSTQEKLARHLIGYQPRQYLANIINDDVAQYKFYQGFIKEKGTLNSITKLFDALRASGFSSIDIKEEWAFKIGEYGASDAYTEIEFPLDEEKFRHNPQNINLTTDSKDFNDLSIYNIIATDVSIKPSNYASNPFKTVAIDTDTTDTKQSNYGVFKYQVAGYVKDSDVDHIVFNEAALLNYDITLFKEKDKIWLGYTSNNDWDVYEYLRTNIIVTGWSVSSNTVSLSCNVIPDVRVNDIIVISNLDSINGSYKVQAVYNNIIDIFTFNSTIFSIQDNITSGVIHVIKSSRYATLDAVSANRYNNTNILGERIWVDTNASGNWLVLENQDAFTKAEIDSLYSKVDNQQYGYKVKISTDNKWMFVSAPYNGSGIVTVYNRPSINSTWSFVQTLLLPTAYISTVSRSEKFGISIDVTADGSALVIGSTDVSDLNTLVRIVHDINGTNINIGTEINDNHSGITNQGIAAVFVYNPHDVRYVLDTVIASYNPFANEKFGNNVNISNDGTNIWLFVSSNSTDGNGQVQIFRKTDGIWMGNTQQNLDFSHYLGSAAPVLSAGGKYGYSLDSTAGALRIVVSAPYTGAGEVYIFERDHYTFKLVEFINSNTEHNYLKDNDLFGYSLVITDRSLFISCPNDNTKGHSVGSVYVFSRTKEKTYNNIYKLNQTISPPVVTVNERFGTNLSINPSNNVLTISAINGNSIIPTSFDGYSNRLSSTGYVLDTNSTKIDGTTFDTHSTLFYDRKSYTGAVYVYNRFDDNFIYGDRLRPINDLVSNDKFGFSVSVTDSTIAVGTPSRSFGNNKVYGTVFTFDYSDLSWYIKQSQNSVIDIDKFKKAFIYNTKTNTLIQNLDFYDPAKGRIPAIADQEIKYQTYYDPAIYQYGVPTEVTVDVSMPWTDEHVGELWWNLSTVKFTWYEQGDSTYKNNNWGRIFTGCTVDIYEWVETTYLPSQWATLADTEAGIAQGISGIPKDIDNFTWSSNFKYDPVSGTKTTLYYYWVKNKNTVPNITFRNLSAANVARLILDPRSQGYQYVFITGESTFSLANINTRLIDTDVSLNLQFYEVDNTELLNHNEYVLIAKDDPNATIPSLIENKWFDSLVGSNTLGQSLPDLKLSKRQQYGNLNIPRQTWFINRFEALKQLFEYVNSVLTNVSAPIVDDIDFSKLMKNDPEPTLNSGDIDQIIDVAYELKFIGISQLKTAVLSLKNGIVDGKLKTVSIFDPGYGYGRNRVYAINDMGDAISWYGPNVKISGTGTGASVQTVIDNQGRVIEAIVIKPGSRYDVNTKITVRDYSVLIRLDEESNNAWSLQAWNKTEKEWARIRTQAYDVTRYWSYKDWFATGYGLSSDVTYQIDRTVDLNGLSAMIGDIVKVNSVGYNGNWLILERIATTYSSDFTNDYKVVGRQAGTIEFSDKLYNVNQDLGFDTKSSFDLSFYDQSSTVELRLILETLRDVILINNLRVEYIKTFFNSVYYVLNEQLFTDWCFKTSFLKANHNVGTLKQRITFQSDEVASYESFIEEAKPYKTKVREWVSSYQYTEETDYITTDFDLPPYFNNDPKSNKIEVTNLLSPNIDQYPWKSWLDHHTYQIADIMLKDGGSNYTTRPMVIISGGGGTGAKASAYIANGSVYKIVIDDPGTGFISAPVVLISGGNGNVDSTRAKAYALLGKALVRTNLIGMKFDRYTNSYTVDSFKHTDYLSGTGNQTKFKLTFAPETEKSKFFIFVNGIRYYGSQFDVSILKVKHDTYTALEGYINFTQAPIKGTKNIEVTYDKSIKLYPAADRINYAYSPTVGQYGKDLAQLMTGIDYGGVTITSIDFEVGGGWDVLPWDVTSWDNVLTTNDDYVVISDGITRSFVLPYIPAIGEIINVYLNNIRIDDDCYFDSFSGDGINNIVTIPVDILLKNGDVLTFRKSTSDGSILPTDVSLIDSMISGGVFSYSSASGVNPEDIIIDGDGFVTTDTSHGPEELVQGQVFDTLDITVYHAPSPGGPNVSVNNYVGDGVTNQWIIRQLPGTSDGIIALVDGVLTGNTVNYTDNTIALSVVPANLSKIAIITFDTAGYDILDKGVLVGDGTTKEFLTAARYSKDNVTVFVTVNGLAVGATIKSSTASNSAAGNVLMQFSIAPSSNSIIQFMVLSGDIQKYSKVTNENIPLVTNQKSYTLTTTPSVKKPASANVFVVIDGEYLAAPNYKNYVYDGTNLIIGDPKYLPYSLSQSDINLYRNGIVLTPIRDFLLDVSQNTISITANAAVNGDELILEIIKGNDYIINDNQITLGGNFNLVNKNTMTVTTFTNHDIVKTKRTSKGFTFTTGYDRLGYDTDRFDTLSTSVNTGGIFNLPKSVTKTSGVFVILTHKLLSPNVDYVVLDNLNQIKVKLPDILTGKDYIEIITTNDQTLHPSFGFKMFKDMLNRNSYKALDNNSITSLSRDLSVNDTTITVTDGSMLSNVNNSVKSGNRIPGVIEINGERIEYFVKNGNVLSQLRRGTLGTSVNINVLAGARVYDIGPKLTLPYADRDIKRTAYGDGTTKIFEFDLVLHKTNNSTWYRKDIPPNFGQCDTIEVYVAGRRLIKTPRFVYDQTLGQDSYNGAGDRQIEAEFSVDGVSKSVRLTAAPNPGELIVIIAKQGKIWQKSNENLPLVRSTTDIARFLNTKQVDLPK